MTTSEQPTTGPTTIELPELCLVVLVGVTGAGKSTFAHKHFAPTEVLSSDTFRGLVADDPTDQSATADAFDALFDVAGRRLRRGLLTVVDATSVRPEDRRSLLALAKEHDVFAVAVVLDVELDVLIAPRTGPMSTVRWSDASTDSCSSRERTCARRAFGSSTS